MDLAAALSGIDSKTMGTSAAVATVATASRALPTRPAPTPRNFENEFGIQDNDADDDDDEDGGDDDAFPPPSSL